MHQNHYWAGVLALGTIGALSSANAVAKDTTGDEWRFSFSPYLWMSSIDSTLQFTSPRDPSRSIDVDSKIEFSDLFEDLNFGLMGTGDARHGRWVVETDLMYSNVEAKDTRVTSIGSRSGLLPSIGVSGSLNAGTKAEVQNVIWTLAGGYAVIPEGPVTLDALAGVRLYYADADLDVNLTADITGPMGETVLTRSTSVSESDSVWDGIIAVRGDVKFGASKWNLRYYGDVGTGDSELTYQGMLALAYQFGWGDAVAGYRYLAYEQGGDALLQDVAYMGPVLGATFRF